jgi:subtilase family serine protease
VVWNEAGIGSTGGGASAIYPRPAWQAAPGVPSDGRRDVPDVSLATSLHDDHLVYEAARCLRWAARPQRRRASPA